MQLWDDVLGILAAPFTGPLDIKSLFLMVGVVIAAAIFWFFILNSLRQAAAEAI